MATFFYPACFPADVWGTIADFTASDPQHAMQSLSLIHPDVRTGIEACDALWYRFLVRWPNARPRAGTFTAYRARCRAASATAPIPDGELHPIEHCHVEFACPYFAEGKGIRLVEGGSDPELENGGLPVYFCSICNDHVFSVASQEVLDARVAERRCVVVSKDSASARPDRWFVTAEVVVCATEENVARRFVRAMKAFMLQHIREMDGDNIVDDAHDVHDTYDVEETWDPRDADDLMDPGTISIEGDNFVWRRKSASPVRIRAFWSAAKRFDATACQTSLLIVINGGKDHGWQWPHKAGGHAEFRAQQAQRERYSWSEYSLYLGRIEPVSTPEAAVGVLNRCFPSTEIINAGELSCPRRPMAENVVNGAVKNAANGGELVLKWFTVGPSDGRGAPRPIPLTPSLAAIATTLTTLHIEEAECRGWGSRES